jgi:hypothetical protein
MLKMWTLLLPLLAACATDTQPSREPDTVARIQAMQEHLENLRARGAIHPEKYSASKAQLDAELRRAQRD